MDARLEPELVLECDCIRGDQVETIDLGKKILFAELSVFFMPFVDVNPDKASKVLGLESELCPVFTAVIVSLVGSGASEA